MGKYLYKVLGNLNLLKLFLLEINLELEIPEVTSFPTVNTLLTGAKTAPTNPEPNPLKKPPTPAF